MKFIVGIASTVSFGSGIHNLPGSSFAFLVDSLKLRGACLESNVVSTLDAHITRRNRVAHK